MALPERHEYESIIYGLQSEFQEIDSSTLRVYSTSSSAGTLVGEVTLKNGLRIRAVEVLDFGAGVKSIKHNRKPAEGISFEAPNLPVLIKICIGLG